jgi:hypothetical protein
MIGKWIVGWLCVAALVNTAVAKEPGPAPDRQQREINQELQALRQQWEEHAEKPLALEVLQELPINSDDEFRLVLGKHLYELVFELIDNSEC